ncbi:hypothetical protein Ais01nite_14280 [Asanoa ishikariensis]|uniref:Uncharacterized protein n=1 Tax=Asanoa ishikariensis TaxID=137265 RepID=A0A1H3UK23_9ACTN|nr:hypothetical protein [Asanoa ishikariensis]GIF63393.1 hypothetical protein Ais01nite_14280 [Asanoa ishikariensis]SDZ62371.1 hypothetical protein SAMN05421684_7445 [Asanoa ishikariensis]
MEVDFGAGPRRLPRSIEVLNLTAAGGLVPAAGRIDWTQLSALPALRTVEWSGPDRGLVDALATRSDIGFLEWHDAVGEVDLRSTGLDTVRLYGSAFDSLRLPASIRTLLLRRPSASLRVEAADLGEWLDLRLFPYGGALSVPTGLTRVPTLWLWVGAEVSARALSGLTNLRDLRLTFESPPGVVSDLADLGRHQRLHHLRMDDAYGLDPAALPELSSLRGLSTHGTRHTIAQALEARFEGEPVELSITGAKSEAWLADYLDNPFRDWVEESEPFARAACEAYLEAVRSIESVAPDAERVLRDFVARLNAIDEEHELIDTFYREQAGDAFDALAQRLGVPGPVAGDWFDETREF